MLLGYSDYIARNNYFISCIFKQIASQSLLHYMLCKAFASVLIYSRLVCSFECQVCTKDERMAVKSPFRSKNFLSFVFFCPQLPKLISVSFIPPSFSHSICHSVLMRAAETFVSMVMRLAVSNLCFLLAQRLEKPFAFFITASKTTLM